MSQGKNKLFSFLSYLFMLFFRVIPINSTPGIKIIGNPTNASPVIVTSNYALTVRRVINALKNIDCYLMIIPTKGINVWCASVGKIFTTEKLLFCLRAFELEKLVLHRNLIVPELAAAGISRWAMYEKSGWDIIWGPTDIGRIKYYINNSKLTEVDKHDRLVNFNTFQAFEMACAITGSIFLRFFIFVLLIFGLKILLLFPIIVWASVYPAYLNFSKSEKIDWYLSPYITVSANVLILYLITGIYAELIFLGMGIIFLLNISLYSYLPYVTCKYSSKFFGISLYNLEVNQSNCTLCEDCLAVCPTRALSITLDKIDVCNSSCVKCGACINQCQFEAIGNIIPKKNFGIFSH